MLFTVAVGFQMCPTVRFEELLPGCARVVSGCGAVVEFIPDTSIFDSDRLDRLAGCEHVQKPLRGVSDRIHARFPVQLPQIRLVLFRMDGGWAEHLSADASDVDAGTEFP